MPATTMRTRPIEPRDIDERERALRWLDTQLRWETRLGRYRSLGSERRATPD